MNSTIQATTNVPGLSEKLGWYAPFQRNGIRLPGLPVLPDNVERHTVPGGGSRALEVEAGDVLSVLNVAGLQPVELVHFTPEGRSDAAVLGKVGVGAALGVHQTLQAGGASGRKVAGALERAGFSLDKADVVRLFDEEAPAGELLSVPINASGLLIIAAPGGPMAPESQNVPSEIVLFIERITPRSAAERLAPPRTFG